jgi:beta-lactamase superfamily II metal-dependent hydrolase
MFRIEMLPAQQGDALWIEYGDQEHPIRVLIDAGTPPTNEVVKGRILHLDAEDRRFELLIVTHIDTDHIGGVLKLLADGSLGLTFDEVWFNAWRHLQEVPTDRLGPIDGEILSTLLDRLGWPWNRAYGEGPAVIPDDGSLPTHSLPGGLTLTLLSPGPAQLLALRREWAQVVQDAGLDPSEPGRSQDVLAELAAKKGVRLDRLGVGAIDVEKLAETPFVPDRAVANGSTIAVLAEFDGKAALLCGDGFPDVIEPNVRRLLQERDRPKLALDALKLPHHGSLHNVSNELLSALSCSRYLFSSNGNIFGHPDQAAVARVIVNGGREPALLFNYRTPLNDVWDDPDLRGEFEYEVVYPPAGQEGLAVDL